jgi:hypothetical protein
MRIIGFHLANIWEQGTKGCLVPHHFISTECLSTEYVQQTGTSKQETVLPFISETILARGTDQGTSLSLIPTIIVTRRSFSTHGRLSAAKRKLVHVSSSESV